MKASEALKQLRAKGSLDEMLGLLMGEPLQRAIESLEREAEREEQERPKVTLEEMAEACSYASGLACGPHVEWLDLAADTLRKLDEEGGKLMARHANTTFACCCDGCVLAHSLGVEKKP